MEIRATCTADNTQIDTLLNAAFNGTEEAKLVRALRRDGDIEISLVAMLEANIVGHIVLSKMSGPVRCLGLAPVSVLPNQQNQGIGSALIRHSMAMAKSSGWQAVFLLGHAKYYSRFGFSSKLAQAFASPYAGPNFMAVELQDDVLENKRGSVNYAPAFSSL